MISTSLKVSAIILGIFLLIISASLNIKFGFILNATSLHDSPLLGYAEYTPGAIIFIIAGFCYGLKSHGRALEWGLLLNFAAIITIPLFYFFTGAFSPAPYATLKGLFVGTVIVALSILITSFSAWLGSRV